MAGDAARAARAVPARDGAGAPAAPRRPAGTRQGLIFHRVKDNIGSDTKVLSTRGGSVFPAGSIRGDRFSASICADTGSYKESIITHHDGCQQKSSKCILNYHRLPIVLF